MKSFLGTFAICFILLYLFAFFFLQFFWAVMGLTAFLIAAAIIAYIGQATQIEELEKRIARLETEKESPAADNQ